MIQELLGGGVVEGRKMSVPGGLLGPTTTTTHEPPPCSSVHSTASSTTSPVASSTTSSNSEQQNLRCPRCDSTNTKFCYYNNYNLTQPRHFCKTCRRYWTQGGALRNVPIGGGCRKTKSSAGISLGAGKPCGGSAGNKPKPLASDVVLGKAAAGLQGGAAAMVFDHDLPSSPILWTTTPHSSHLLSLLRATHNSAIGNPNSSNPGHNPNPNPIRNTHNTVSPVRVKEEGAPMVGSHLVPEASLLINALNARSLGLDPLGQVPLGLCGSLWRSSQYPHQQPQPHPQPHNNGMLLGDQNHGSSGIQELFQRLRSTGNCYNDHPAAALGNVGSTTTTSSFSSPISFSTTPTAATTTTTILEPTPAVGGGEFGCWNAPFAWADMPNTNGAFP